LSRFVYRPLAADQRARSGKEALLVAAPLVVWGAMWRTRFRATAFAFSVSVARCELEVSPMGSDCRNSPAVRAARTRTLGTCGVFMISLGLPMGLTRTTVAPILRGVGALPRLA
jgi:hypothetical protein